MEIESDVQEVIDKINSGELNELLSQLNDTDFGVYVPTFEDHGTIKKMLNGYSQTERDLVISVSLDEVEDDALPIGWFGSLNGKDVKCRHPGVDKCKHCTGHTGPTKNCNHPIDSQSNPFIAPELDYPNVVQDINDKQELLEQLSSEGLGITLLHGHNSEHMFTKLPPEYVSVITNGKTEFRLESDVTVDTTFVPSTWRLINGELRVSGGHSQLAGE